MNFVISHEQTSQSGTNPVILPPDLSDRGRRRRRPGSGASAGAAAAAHRARLPVPAAPRQPLAPGSGCAGAEHGREVRGPSSTSPDNQGWREAARSDGLRRGSRHGRLHLSRGAARVGPEVEAGRGGTARTSLGKCGGAASTATTWLPGLGVFFCIYCLLPK